MRHAMLDDWPLVVNRVDIVEEQQMVSEQRSAADFSMESSVSEEKQIDETSRSTNGDLVAYTPTTGECDNEVENSALSGPEAQAELYKDNNHAVDVRSMDVGRTLEQHQLSGQIGHSANRQALTGDESVKGEFLSGQRYAAADDRNDGAPGEEAQVTGRYLNNLHPAVGYLDFANALDFPANVWNSIPIPVFALVLMGLGGSIAILTVGFAIWDYRRSRRNITVLRAERAWLDKKLASLAEVDSHAKLMLQAWQDISFRELGWEAIDRVLMDIIMGVAGILVGTGTLLAIRGDNPAIFEASNLMSGYIGNSLVVFYAFVNLLWSIYMFRRARHHRIAIRNAARLSMRLRDGIIKHGKKHEWYAALNGLTIVVSSVGSMISATMWQGYVVLIPCVIGSVYCNWFWRKRLGYDREPARVWLENPGFDIDARLQDILATDSDKSSKSGVSDGKSLDVVYEGRFLLELYGCYLARRPETNLPLSEKPGEAVSP